METVRVVSEITKDNDQGYIVINKSDLTKDMTLYKPVKQEKKKEKKSK